jgi:CelD/BcsL family acetyltransferase involved in cellulose biosynthesis
MGSFSTPALREKTGFAAVSPSNDVANATIDTANPAARNCLQVRVLKSFAEVTRFETQWRNLEEKAAKPHNVFQSYDWCANWIKSCTLDNDCYGVYIVTVSRGDECLVIWPMMSRCSGPFSILCWLSDPYSQYGDVLAADDKYLNTALDLAWDQLKSHPVADSIRFRHVRQDATIAAFLDKNTQHDNHIDYAPFLEIDKFPTEQAYDTRYTKSQRRRRKRIRKNLEQFGPVQFNIANSGKKFAQTMAIAVAEKRKWLSERGLYSKPVMSDEIETFFINMAENGKTLRTVASQLNAGEKKVSFEIGLRFKNRHFGYITAHDAKLTDASPGRLHMDLSQRAAINDGMDAFDLMVPADPHKKTWSSSKVKTCDYFTHLNTRGAVYSILYLKALRPCVRWLYLKAPSTVRRYITRFAS